LINLGEKKKGKEKRKKLTNWKSFFETNISQNTQ